MTHAITPPITGETFAALRRRAGLSQAEVGRRMGVTRQRVANLEGLLRVAPEAATRYLTAVESLISVAEVDA